MEQTRKLKPSVWRIIGYVILLALVVFAYILTNGYFLIAMMVLMLGLPCISLTLLWILSGRLEACIMVEPKEVSSKDRILVELQLKNPTWIPALDCEWALDIANSFLENKSSTKVFMPVHVHGISRICLPLQLEELGRFTFSEDRIWIRDLMGLARCRITCHVMAETRVVPQKISMDDVDIQNYLYGVAESEESDQKGNDCSEVSDIREYIPGDRIRDIHWKLSAKQDILMVKERVAMAGSEMVLMLEMKEDWNVTRQILHMAYTVGVEFVDIHTPVCYLCWNQQTFAFDEYRCNSQDEITEAFCKVYDVPLRMRKADDSRAYLSHCYPFLYTYLAIEEKDGKVQMEMRENG